MALIWMVVIVVCWSAVVVVALMVESLIVMDKVLIVIQAIRRR
jgi:hypothetical protein